MAQLQCDLKEDERYNMNVDIDEWYSNGKSWVWLNDSY